MVGLVNQVTADYAEKRRGALEDDTAGKKRDIPNRIAEFLKIAPDLEVKYQRAREIVRIFRRGAFYEITQRCNLFCEGCYYFEDESADKGVEESDIRRWDDFFRSEGRRGVSLGFFVGAEPALEQNRLRAATRYLPYGIIGTNGTIRISEDIQTRIHVSLWTSDPAEDRRLRGAPAIRKALKNYAGDPRAIIAYTLSPWNIDDAGAAARMCDDHGIPLTFNYFSPTDTYLGKIRSAVPNDGSFFRLSNAGENMCFGQDDLKRAYDVVAELMERFPDTIIYSDKINKLATQAAPVHDIDPATGIATRCGSLIKGNLKYFTADLVSRQVKCCTPGNNCGECRIYSSLWSTRLLPTHDDVATSKVFEDWIDLILTLGKVWIYPDKRVQTDHQHNASMENKPQPIQTLTPPTAAQPNAAE